MRCTSAPHADGSICAAAAAMYILPLGELIIGRLLPLYLNDALRLSIKRINSAIGNVNDSALDATAVLISRYSLHYSLRYSCRQCF